MQLQVGMVTEGKVTGITKFGAFVALPEGKSGLVHISEIANTFVSDVHDYVQDGQTVKVKVIGISEDGKINLSIKKALPQQERPAFRPRTGGAPRAGGASAHTGAQRSAPQSRPAFARQQQSTLAPSADQSFEDKLKQFLSSSEGKMADLNRSIDGKRGGGRRRR